MKYSHRPSSAPVSGYVSRFIRRPIGVLLLLGLVMACTSCRPAVLPISGRVISAEGLPVSGATVRVQATAYAAVTDPEGRFLLSVPRGPGPVSLTASAPGFFIAGPASAEPGAGDISLTLLPHPNDDNPSYSWQTSFFPAGAADEIGCAACHQAAGTGYPHSLPVDEWQMDAHSGTNTNARFLTMYLGTDTAGRSSPPTRYVSTKDYGTAPVRPEPDAAYFGPGYLLDFPGTAGNCATCHTPTAAVNAPFDTDPTALTGVAAEGIACDFCHKVFDIRLDPVTGLPYQNLPGVLSFEFRRPPEGHQFFSGPLDDVAPGEDVHSPLQKQSQFCAACHYGVFWDVVIYDSFGEWLRSPYSSEENGQTCQDCHMPRSGATRLALPDQGGLERDPETIFSHRMPGAADETLLQNSVSMTVAAITENKTLELDITLINDRAGHAVPTDSPLRHLVLVVRAEDENNRPLKLLEGSLLPDWLGIGEPDQGFFAGQPGQVFAKVLAEQWTNVSPTAAYWNPTYVISDNRLFPFEPARASFRFDLPADGKMMVEIRLLYRRAFIELAGQKGWPLNDILMEEQSLVLER